MGARDIFSILKPHSRSAHSALCLFLTRNSLRHILKLFTYRFHFPTIIYILFGKIDNLIVLFLFPMSTSAKMFYICLNFPRRVQQKDRHGVPKKCRVVITKLSGRTPGDNDYLCNKCHYHLKQKEQNKI